MITILLIVFLVMSVVAEMNYTHIFSTFVFEGAKMQRIGQKFDVPCASRLSATVHGVCSTFPTWNLIDCSLCVQNIHFYQISEQTQSVLDLSFPQRYDITVSFLLKYYEFLLESYSENSTICLYGDFSPHILYSTLSLLPFRIRMFADEALFNEYEVEGMQLLSLQLLFPDRLDITRNSLDKFVANVNTIRSALGSTPLQPTCSILHFRGDNVSISNALETIRKAQFAFVGLSDSVPVIWEKSDRDNMFKDTSSVKWKMRGDWYSGSFNLSENDLPLRCGIAKLQTVYHNSSVWLGSAVLRDDVSSASDSCVVGDGEVHFLITFTEFIFLETALGIQDALLHMGVHADHIHVPGLLNVTIASSLLENDGKVLQIVVGPHQPTLLLQHYLLFHTENFESAFIDLPHYKVLMQGALGVLVYSWVHSTFVQESFEVPRERVFVIPFYSHSPYLEETLSERRESDGYTYQVYFYGTKSERRNKFDVKISQYFSERGVTTLTTLGVNNPLFDPYDGHTKEWLIKHSRVVVSIHSGGPENRIVLETHRINHLLSQGKIVVTEPSFDPDLDAQYADSIIFSKVEDICATVETLLADEERMEQLEKKARLKYHEISGNVHNFSLAIDQALRIAFDL